MRDPTSFLPLHLMARRTGLPASWLKAQALAGRIPSLRAGHRLMFPLAAEEALIEHARRSPGKPLADLVGAGSGAEA